MRIRVAALIPLLAALLTWSCSDGAAPTQPRPQPTPQPTPQSTRQPTPQSTRQPTPQPTRQPTPQSTPQPTPQPTHTPLPSDPLSVHVTLEALTPTAGFRHQVRATLDVRELRGKNVQLKKLWAYNYFNDEFEVSGFTPRDLTPGERAVIVATLSTRVDVPCDHELYVMLGFYDGTQNRAKGGYFDCSYRDWPF